MTMTNFDTADGAIQSGERDDILDRLAGDVGVEHKLVGDLPLVK